MPTEGNIEPARIETTLWQQEERMNCIDAARPGHLIDTSVTLDTNQRATTAGALEIGKSATRWPLQEAQLSTGAVLFRTTSQGSSWKSFSSGCFPSSRLSRCRAARAPMARRG